MHETWEIGHPDFSIEIKSTINIKGHYQHSPKGTTVTRILTALR